MNKQNLLEHHIHFLSKHRGERESLEQVEFIHSEKPSFNIAFPRSLESIEKISSLFQIYLPDWISEKEQSGFSQNKTGSITYMILPEQKNNWNRNNKIVIKKAVSLSDIEDFSLVQGKGFCETEDIFNEWHPWMREKNISNLNDINQNFYIAYENKKPVGVCLCIYHNNIVGIYAVATLPECRKQGISTSIMLQIIEDGVKNNVSLITLQVATNSYAHSFYRHLGFNDTFQCAILSKNK